MEVAMKLSPHRTSEWVGTMVHANEERYKSTFLGRPPLKLCSGGHALERRRQGLVTVALKKRNMLPQGRTPQRVVPTLPKAEDDSPRFVLFIRSTNVPLWYPLNVVSGGTTAKFMVGAMKNDWGKKFYEGTLTRNIAGVIYKDEKKMIAAAVKNYKTLKTAKEFEYGYKIVDNDKPNDALIPTDVTVIPPREEMKSVVDKAKDFFANSMTGMKESFGSIGSLSSEPEEDKDLPKPTKSKKST